MRTKVQLQSDVRTELAWDPSVDDKDINITSEDGVVTLSGTVPTYANRLAAERAAERVYGVSAVANELTVVVPLRFQRTDTDIAQAVVDALMWDVEVPDMEVKAAVSSGWVTLVGDVEWRYQRDAAARAVRNLAGVRGVKNNITITAKPVSSYDVGKAIKDALERRASILSKKAAAGSTHVVIDMPVSWRSRARCSRSVARPRRVKVWRGPRICSTAAPRSRNSQQSVPPKAACASRPRRR